MRHVLSRLHSVLTVVCALCGVCASLCVCALHRYVTWRGLPRALAMRVTKHAAFVHQRRGAFDEQDIINGLAPALRAEVTHFYATAHTRSQAAPLPASCMRDTYVIHA